MTVEKSKISRNHAALAVADQYIVRMLLEKLIIADFGRGDHVWPAECFLGFGRDAGLLFLPPRCEFSSLKIGIATENCVEETLVHGLAFTADTFQRNRNEVFDFRHELPGWSSRIV